MFIFDVFGNKSSKRFLTYIFTMFFLKSIGFLTIPLFSRLLTLEEFGRFILFVSLSNLFSILFGLEIYKTISRATLDFAVKFNDYIGNILFVSILSGIGFTFLTLFLNSIFNFLSFSMFEFLLLFTYLLSHNSVLIFLTYFRFTNNHQKFSFFSIFIGLTVIFLSLLFMILFDDNYIARLIGFIIPHFIVAIYLITTHLRKFRPKLNFLMIKYSIFYSIPFIPIIIAQSLNSEVAKIYISQNIGLESTAIYSLAFSVGMIVNMFQTSVKQAWLPTLITHLKDHKNTFVIKSVNIFVSFLSLISIFTLFFANEIVFFFGGEKFSDSLLIIKPLMISFLILGIVNLFYEIEVFYKKNYILSIINTTITITYTFIIIIFKFNNLFLYSVIYLLMTVFLFIAHFIFLIFLKKYWIIDFKNFILSISFVFLSYFFSFLNLTIYSRIIFLIIIFIVLGYYNYNSVKLIYGKK
jgi:O-antigen/teichoic acid export membrane protein